MEKLGKVKIVHANMKNKENEFLYEEEKAKELLLWQISVSLKLKIKL